MINNKKTLLIDLDGVLNTYQGELDKNNIPPIKDGAKEFIEKLYQNNYELKLFTTRNKILVTKWLIENNIEKFFVDITNVKDLCWLFIDDRCIQFKGDYSNLFEQITSFKAWYKEYK